MNKERPVVVHANNAIFFGYLISHEGKEVKLHSARNAYYWKCERGMLELANSGPKLGSKIGDRADITLTDVVMIQECKSEAIDAWESLKWGN